MKKVYITVILTCAVILSGVILCFKLMDLTGRKEHITVGFIYDNDESTPYTYNFSLAKDAIEKKYGDKVDILTSSNVLDDEMEEPLRDLARAGCDIIFFNGYSELVPKLAPDYPDTQFCQASYMDMEGVLVPDNYHTFKGEAYQGRYVSGIAAGMKIKEMIETGSITENQALVGFVAAFPTSEVISGYTAFILGVRSVVPTAVMRVCYTHTWSSYAQEKDAAERLINEGCVVISQHTDTIGPAIACEDAVNETEGKEVYFVGNNQSMSEVAPGTSLVTSRICWEPYILSAVEAVMSNKKIEKVVVGNIHGSDASAGFERGWVEMIDLNLQVAAEGTQEAMNSAIEEFKKGNGNIVFKGDYIGVDPDNPSNTIDLTEGYVENAHTSYPLFDYVLKDVITIEE